MHAISDASVRACCREIQDISREGVKYGFPVDVHAIAKFLGVKAIEPSELNIDGYIGKNASGHLVIRYRRSNSPQRNRFTIAHEIGHLLIAKVTGDSIDSRKMRTGYDNEERIANHLAAEILIPRSVLKEQLGHSCASWKYVQSLRRFYDVSSFAMLRRTTEIDGVASVFARFGISANTQRRWFACDSSHNPIVSFKQRFEKLVYEQLQCVARTSFTTTAHVDEHIIELPCEILPSKNLVHQETWVYGWMAV